MNKPAALIKKIVTVVLGVFGIGTITSCYGMPPVEGENEFFGKVYESWIDEESGKSVRNPLEDVKVFLRSTDRDCLLDIDRTDEEGYYRVYTYSQGENGELIFEYYKDDEAKANSIKEFGGYYETKRISVKLEFFDNRDDREFCSTNLDAYLEWIEVSSDNNEDSSGN